MRASLRRAAIGIILILTAGCAATIITAPRLAPGTAWLLALLGPEASLDAANRWLRSLAEVDASGLAYVEKLITGGAGFVIAFILAVWCVAFAALLLWIVSSRSQREVRGGVYETGRVITSQAEIARRCFLWNGSPHPQCGIAVGAIGGRSVVFPANHAVCIAPSGSSKTRGSVYETADLLTIDGENSLLVTDPSGEIHAMLREGLERRGYRIELIDLAEPPRGCRINPISGIKRSYLAGNAAYAEAKAREIGDMLAPEQNSENDIFTRAAGGVISAVSYLVATLEEIPDERRHLWSVVQTVLAGTVNGTEPLKRWIRGFGADSPPVAMSATFLSAEDKLEASILSSLHDALQFLTSAHIKWLTSGDDLSAEDLMHERVAVFIRMLPPGNQANKLASLFLSQYVNEMLRANDRGSLRPVYVLADEAHAIPKFPLITSVEQGRKYKSHFYLWLQSQEGLSPYNSPTENGRAAILANADVKVLYKAGTPSDAELFSKYGGERTVRTRSTNSSKGLRGAGSSEGYSEQHVQNWPISRILNRDPRKDGVLVAANMAHDARASGCYEIPMADVTETPTARNFPTFGTRDHEARVLRAENARLAALAKSRCISAKAWTPAEFEMAEDGVAPNPGKDVFGLEL